MSRPECPDSVEPRATLTALQLHLFDWTIAYTRHHFYQPSVAGMMAEMGLASPNSITNHLRPLKRKGLIRLPDCGKVRSRAIDFVRRDPLGTAGYFPAVPPWVNAEVPDALTPAQARIFNFMVDYTVEHFYQPSLREVVDRFGYGGPNGVYCHLRALHKKGLVRLGTGGPGQARAIEFLRRTPVPVYTGAAHA